MDWIAASAAPPRKDSPIFVLVSEPDSGIYDALNKGLGALAWKNLSKLRQFFQR